jgi:hypothetical protein
MTPPPDDPPSPSARSILERCLVENDGAAWVAFLAAYSGLVRQAFFAAPSGVRYEEFADWFPGWLYEKRKLHAVYRALLAKVAAGECPTAGHEDEYVRNYLVGVVGSAVGDWFRQHRPPPARPAAGAPADPPEVEFADAVARLRAALGRLDAELRVPFWLRHSQALGPLLPADAAWVAEALGTTPEAVADAVAREAAAQPDPDRPLSSRFIGRLLGLPPLGNGKYAAVDQRIRRARLLLRQLLQAEGEPCSS